jgi:hypothetical protein
MNLGALIGAFGFGGLLVGFAWWVVRKLSDAGEKTAKAQLKYSSAELATAQEAVKQARREGLAVEAKLQSEIKALKVQLKALAKAVDDVYSKDSNLPDDLAVARVRRELGASIAILLSKRPGAGPT